MELFSAAMDAAASRKEEERKKWADALPPPVLFIPDEDDPDMGVGWWRAQGGFVAYRKWKNGWHPERYAQLEDALLLALHPHIK